MNEILDRFRCIYKKSKNECDNHIPGWCRTFTIWNLKCWFFNFKQNLSHIYQPPANPAGLSWAWDCKQHGQKHRQKQQQQQQQHSIALAPEAETPLPAAWREAPPKATATAATTNSSNNNSNNRKPTANKNSSTGEHPGGIEPETFWIWGGFGGRGACACGLGGGGGGCF